MNEPGKRQRVRVLLRGIGLLGRGIPRSTRIGRIIRHHWEEREKERGNPKTENTGEVEKVIGSKRDRAGSAKPNLGTGVKQKGSKRI
jgi:hypothetical protein